MLRKLKVGIIGGGLSSEVGKIHISSMLYIYTYPCTTTLPYIAYHISNIP